MLSLTLNKENNMQVPLNRETMEIMTNFFEMNEDGTFSYSEKKHRESIEKQGVENDNV